MSTPPKNHYSSKSTINIYNDTDYNVTVFFSGRSSKKITLIPHLSQAIDLASGEYSVAARVEDARSIRPYAGKETLTGGEYSERFYIETISFRR